MSILTGALILITTKVGGLKDVHEKLEDMEEIEQVEMLTGPYDIMALARAEEMTEITKALIEKIRSIPEVEDTITNIFIE